MNRNPANIYLFKVNNRNTWYKCEIRPIQWRRPGTFIVKFQISHLFLAGKSCSVCSDVYYLNVIFFSVFQWCISLTGSRQTDLENLNEKAIIINRASDFCDLFWHLKSWETDSSKFQKNLQSSQIFSSLILNSSSFFSRVFNNCDKRNHLRNQA